MQNEPMNTDVDDEMCECVITIENLFELIKSEELCTFDYDREYVQSTKLQIQNECGVWIPITGLIKKQSPLIHFTFVDGDSLICADTHLFSTNSGELKKAADYAVGTILECFSTHKTIRRIVHLPTDDVFDIEVMSPTHLYQCAMGIIHHNTLLTSAIIAYANRLNMRTITVVPSSSLLKQTHDYIKQFDIPIGMFGNGRNDESNNIVATWQTLKNNRAYIRDFDCIVWDECVSPQSMIMMGDDTEKTIDSIVVGDIVKTFNETTKEIESKPVVQVHKNLLKSADQQMLRLTLEDGSVVELTANHEVLTNNGWKRADNLVMDDEIINLNDDLNKPIV